MIFFFNQLILFLCVYLNPRNIFLVFLVISDDPEVPHVQHHREFLKENVVFKEVYFVILLLSSIVGKKQGVR
jgi:hypothetical protein